MKENNIELSNTAEEAAKLTILGILDEVNAMGGNDYEVPAILSILERLRNKQCQPDKAIEEAMAIKVRKNDYH